MPSIAAGVTFRGQSLRLTFVPGYLLPNRYGFIYNTGKRATYFSVDIKEKVFKEKFIIQLSNYFIYDEFRSIRKNLPSQEYTSEKRLKRDHFLDIMYQIKLKKDWFKLLVGAGIGVMNCNTKFTYDRPTGGFDSLGNSVVLKNVPENFRYFAPRFIIGLQAGRLNSFVIAHKTPDMLFFFNPTVWLEFKATYSMPLRKKAKKTNTLNFK
jgi:hypothetical protein